MNAADWRLPSLMIRTLPVCSTTKSRSDPSPACVTRSGDERPARDRLERRVDPRTGRPPRSSMPGRRQQATTRRRRGGAGIAGRSSSAPKDGRSRQVRPAARIRRSTQRRAMPGGGRGSGGRRPRSIDQATRSRSHGASRTSRRPSGRRDQQSSRSDPNRPIGRPRATVDRPVADRVSVSAQDGCPDRNAAYQPRDGQRALRSAPGRGFSMVSLGARRSSHRSRSRSYGGESAVSAQPWRRSTAKARGRVSSSPRR